MVDKILLVLLGVVIGGVVGCFGTWLAWHLTMKELKK